MRANHVKRRLNAGGVSIGGWMALPSPEAAAYLAGSGLDWLLVDTEHAAIDIRDAGLMFDAMASHGVAPFARVPSSHSDHIKRVLDAGAWGVVVPMVMSPEEAQRVVEAVRYPPDGRRSIGGLRHMQTFAASPIDYYGNANREVLLAVQIEHIDAVNRVEEILSVPGIDICFVGPGDLAASMGLPRGTGNAVPEFAAATGRVLAAAPIRLRGPAAAARQGVAAGTVASSAETAKARVAEGYQFVSIGNDINYLVEGVRDNLKQLEWAPTARELI